MRNHNILRDPSQHLTQTSKVKVTEPETAKNVIFDGRYPLISSFTVRFTRKGHQTMRNHNIFCHHSQHLTQMSKVKVTEPKTAKNVIFDGRYPLISSFTVRFTRKGHQTMCNHNILRHHSQHLTQRSKVKVTEPETAKNVIFDGRYPPIFFIYCPIYSQWPPNDAQSQYLASPFATFDPEVKGQGHRAKNS